MKNGKNVQGMESVIATVSGYHGSERFNLIKLISLSGANYVGALSKSTTHLVCWKFEGEKYTLAKKFNTIIVNHQWVEECVKQGKRVHEYPYMIQSGQEVGALSLKWAKLDRPELVNKSRKALSEKSNFDEDYEDCGTATWTSSVLLDENLYPDSRNGNCNSYKLKSKRASKRLKQLCFTSTRFCFQDPPLTGSDRSETRGAGSNSSMHSEKKKSKKLWKEESSNLSGMHSESSKRKVSDDSGSSSLPEADNKGKKIVRMRNNSDSNFDNVVLDLECCPIRLRNKNINAKSLSKCTDDKKYTSTHSNREAIDASMNNNVFNDGAFDDIEEIREWNHPPASKASSSSSMDALTAKKGSDKCTDLDKSNKRLKDTIQHTPGTKSPSAKSANSDFSCVICWTEFSPTRGILPCGHRFCYSCIQSWAAVMVSKRKTSTCPLCKASFVSITKVEDADTSDQKIYSQTIPCGSLTSDLSIFADQERYNFDTEHSSSSNVCTECRFREPEDLLISCHLCQVRSIHSYCLDPPLLPWTCIHCKDLQMLYHQNY